MAQFFTSDGWQIFASIASVVGLGVAVVGIFIAISQLNRIETSTEASRKAIAALKLRISQFDIYQEVAVAESALSRLKDELNNEDADVWRRTCDGLVKSLIAIKEHMSAADVVTKMTLKEAVSHATNLEARPDIERRSSQNDLSKTQESFREIHAALVKIRIKIQREQ
ncbi:hypothetical protein AAG612_09080 [Citromicrobium bathyomarinum]|uniref:hypothetical protein n=1 Tax=Citromicrobium bathyomarinum TaxID=72174 RepID=UPI00315A60CA